MEENDLRKQSASEGQLSTQDVTDENENVNANHTSNTDLPLIAVTFFIIVGLLILSGINIVLESNPIIHLSIFGGISAVVLAIMRTANARRQKPANIYTHVQCYDKKFPADSYSFVALYSPKTDADIFFFGLIVFLFQSTLFLIMILSVIIPRWRTTGEVDNPSSDFHIIPGFIPSNVEPIVRATQIIAILASLVFPDASLLDITTGIEMFPQHWKRDQDEKVWCITYSCILRCVQGCLAMFAVFLLVMTSSDVKDIVLNFTAVNFISLLDDTAFHVAKEGKYGPALEEAARRIENEPLPRCSIPKDKHLRFKITVGCVSTFLVTMIGYVIALQASDQFWVTPTIQVEFIGAKKVAPYSGCYDIDKQEGSSKNRYHYKLSSDIEKFNQTAIAYCKRQRKWIIFNSPNSPDRDPCKLKEKELVAKSSRTDAFDISTSFSDTWYSAANKPLSLALVELGENAKACEEYTRDGVCNKFFNKPEYQFDGGACCATKCTGIECGKGGLNSTTFFGRDIDGDGFQNCIDPDPSIKPVTITLESISKSHPESSESNPELKFECDGNNVFSIPVYLSMENNRETVKVNTESNCTFILVEMKDSKKFSWEMNYSVTDDKNDVIYKGYGSTKKTNEYFSVYNVLDKTLLPIDTRSYVSQDPTHLDLHFVGPVPSIIGLLTKLTDLDLAQNHHTGTLPSNIGLLTELTSFNLTQNTFTGPLPTEIGLLTELTFFNLTQNHHTGTLPSEIENLTKLGILHLDNTYVYWNASKRD